MVTRTPLSAFTDPERALLEDVRRFGDKHNELVIATSKAIGVLNSAGVAAMLAFLQSLLSTALVLAQFKPFGVAALVFFLFGAAISVVPLTFRMLLFGKLYRQDFTGKMTNFDKWAMSAMGAGGLCFALGATAATAGVIRAL